LTISVGPLLALSTITSATPLGLSQEVVHRGPDLVDQWSGPVGEDGERGGRLLRRPAVQATFQSFRFCGCDPQFVGDGVGQLGPANVDRASEAGAALLTDGDAGEVGADRDDRVDGGGIGRRGRGPEQGEQDHVDGDGVEVGGAQGGQVRLDHLAAGGGQQDAHLVAPWLHRRVEDGEVEHRLVDGDGNEALGLELQRQAELLDGHGVDLGRSDDHPLAGDADDDLLGREPALLPKLPEGSGDDVALDHLAVDHRPGGQADLGEAPQGASVAVHGDLGCPHRRRSDVDPDERPLRPDGFLGERLAQTAAVHPAGIGSPGKRLYPE